MDCRKNINKSPINAKCRYSLPYGIAKRASTAVDIDWRVRAVLDPARIEPRRVRLGRPYPHLAVFHLHLSGILNVVYAGYNILKKRTLESLWKGR
jgi:hypothetical protein